MLILLLKEKKIERTKRNTHYYCILATDGCLFGADYKKSGEAEMETDRMATIKPSL